jgi:hypothetical protein
LKIALNTEAFLTYLGQLWATGDWTMHEEDRCIHLWRKGSDTIFSPLTAVYYHLTHVEIHRGSFWVEEFNQGDFQFPWWEILDITYAYMALSAGGREYNKKLRESILAHLGIPTIIRMGGEQALAA